MSKVSRLRHKRAPWGLYALQLQGAFIHVQVPILLISDLENLDSKQGELQEPVRSEL